MGKGIVFIYKYYQKNCPYPSPNTKFFIPQSSDTTIQTQHNLEYDASMGVHSLVSAELDQSTNHNGNTDVNDNYNSQ